MKKAIALILCLLLLASPLTVFADTWYCPKCGRKNTDNFCPQDGTSRPSDLGGTSTASGRSSSYGHLDTEKTGTYYPYMAVIKVSRAEVYASGSTSGTRQGYYTIGERIGLLEVNGNWAKTSFGWVQAADIYVEGHTGSYSTEGVVEADLLTVRTGSGIQYARVRSLGNGEKITIKEQINIGGTWWGYVFNGWICMDYVKTGWTGSSSAGTLPSSAAYLNKGDIVRFGVYEQDNNFYNGKESIEWMVLDIKGNSVLLLSRYGLDTGMRFNDAYTPFTWETSTMRSWLNEEFMSAFSASERSAILLSTIDNSKAQCYNGWNTNGGNNTKDKIFLLSYAEAQSYFGITTPGITGPKKPRILPTTYAVKKDAYLSEDNETADGKQAGWWWLRSPGINQYDIACVRSNGSLGEEPCTEDNGCIRPAMWVSLSAL